MHESIGFNPVVTQKPGKGFNSQRGIDFPNVSSTNPSLIIIMYAIKKTVNINRNFINVSMRILNPNILTSWVHFPNAENRRIVGMTKAEDKLLNIPNIIIIEVRKVHIIPIQIHVKKCWFKAQRNLEKPRIVQNRNVVRVEAIYSKMRPQKLCSSTEISEEPRALGRRREMPRIKQTIFLPDNVHPSKIFFVEKIENIFSH